MNLETPIVVPAVPEESFDKFLATDISINYDNGIWKARYTKRFYKEVDGKKVFAPRQTEQRKEIKNVVTTGAAHPLLLAAFAAVETAIQDLEA